MKIDKATRDRWAKYVRLSLYGHGRVPEDITVANEAWAIAYTLEIPQEAYHIDHSVNDTHIETALRRIMPNVKW